MKRLSMAMTALAVLGLMTMVSCRKPNVINNVPGEARTITFNATTESGNGSKTYLDGLNVNWSAGDQISVNGSTFTLSSGENTTFGSFTGTITGSAPYLAGYPQSGTTYTADPKSLKLNLPDKYTYNDSKVEIPMVSITNSEDGDLSFRNAVNVLKLKLTGDGTTASKLTSIVLKSSTSNLNGDIAVTFSGATPTFGYADGTTTTTVNFEGGKQLTSAEQYVYVVLPKINGGELTIKFNCSNGKYMKKKITVTPDFNAVNNSLGNSEALAVNAQTMPAAAPTSVTTDLGCYRDIYACGGTVMLPMGADQEVEYGFVYSQTESVPEVGKTGCTKFVGGIANMPGGKTSFSVDITGLTPGTTYYIRAYAIGESGTAVHAPNSSDGIRLVYGNDLPQPVIWSGGGTPGASPKEFSVSATTKVRFSQGNLQYIGSAATPYWKFADHQFDFLGKTTGQNSDSETVDRDLFGWGTSGQAHGAICYQPWSTRYNSKEEPFQGYYAYGNVSNHLYSKTPATADWGYNTIYAGNSATTGWRTLTEDECCYLFDTRPDAANKWSLGKVGCTAGMIILPDDWTCPTGLTFTPHGLGWYDNIYNYSDWFEMESAGAVFLPAAGKREYTQVFDQGDIGYYWSSTRREDHSIWLIAFLPSEDYTGWGSSDCDGNSVRLVR